MTLMHNFVLLHSSIVHSGVSLISFSLVIIIKLADTVFQGHRSRRFSWALDAQLSTFVVLQELPWQTSSLV